MFWLPLRAHRVIVKYLPDGTLSYSDNPSRWDLFLSILAVLRAVQGYPMLCSLIHRCIRSVNLCLTKVRRLCLASGTKRTQWGSSLNVPISMHWGFKWWGMRLDVQPRIAWIRCRSLFLLSYHLPFTVSPAAATKLSPHRVDTGGVVSQWRRVHDNDIAWM